MEAVFSLKNQAHIYNTLYTVILMEHSEKGLYHELSIISVKNSIMWVKVVVKMAPEKICTRAGLWHVS